MPWDNFCCDLVPYSSFFVVTSMSTFNEEGITDTRCEIVDVCLCIIHSVQFGSITFEMDFTSMEFNTHRHHSQ